MARLGKFHEGDKSKDIMDRRKIYDLAKELRPRKMLGLAAIRQTVYEQSRAAEAAAEEESSKKGRLEEGAATPGATAPGSRSRNRTPPLRGGARP